MQRLVSHTKFQFLKLIRNPAFMAPTIVFPAMLYAFFGASLPPAGIYSQNQIASFCIYAVLGISFYQFGVGIAQDRESPFDGWLKTLPASSVPQGISQVITAIFFSMVAVGLVLLVSGFLAKTTLTAEMTIRLVAVCGVAAIPASLMGVGLGYASSGRAAPALANLVFLPLAFLGGLWIPPIQMPSAISEISSWTPTRQMGELAWSAIGGQAFEPRAMALFAAYTALFAIIAVLLIARDKRKRFG